MNAIDAAWGVTPNELRGRADLAEADLLAWETTGEIRKVPVRPRRRKPSRGEVLPGDVPIAYLSIILNVEPRRGGSVTSRYGLIPSDALGPDDGETIETGIAGLVGLGTIRWMNALGRIVRALTQTRQNNRVALS